jgi:hypothetical protein
VTALRSDVAVCDDSQVEELERMNDSSWTFPKHTSYNSQNGVCPEKIHSFITVLLYDLSTQLPPSSIQAFPKCQTFPGVCEECPIEMVEITPILEVDAWISMGVWLPAGVVGVIECAEPHPKIQIKIGYHQEHLFENAGHWKRWLLTVTFTLLDRRRIEILSPFGGIVYLVVIGETASSPFELQFEGSLRSPIADAENSEEISNSEVSCGEIKTGGTIFTLPTADLKRMNVTLIDDQFGIIVNEIRKYLGQSQGSLYRLGFDVELFP